MKDWHKKPPPEARSVNDALQDAVRLRRELPLTVQVHASDWDKVILADEILSLRAKLDGPFCPVADKCLETPVCPWPCKRLKEDMGRWRKLED
jgi:hypothetical protein